MRNSYWRCRTLLRPAKLFGLLKSQSKLDLVSHIVVVVGDAAHALLSLCRRDYQGKSYLSFQVDYLGLDTAAWTTEQHDAIDRCHISGIGTVAKLFPSDPLDIAGFYQSWHDESAKPSYNMRGIPILFVPSFTLIKDHNLPAFLGRAAVDGAGEGGETGGREGGAGQGGGEGGGGGASPSQQGDGAQIRHAGHGRKHKAHIYTAVERASADALAGTDRAVPLTEMTAHGGAPQAANITTAAAGVDGAGTAVSNVAISKHGKDCDAPCIWVKVGPQHKAETEEYECQGTTPSTWTWPEAQSQFEEDATLYDGIGDSCLTVKWGAGEGFGSEYNTVINVYVIAALRKWRYCHSEHLACDHGHDLDPFRIQGMMGFTPQDCSQCITMSAGEARMVAKRAGNRIYTLKAMSKVRNVFFAGASRVLDNPTLRKACQYLPDRTTVAVHIRRGDITPARRPDRYINATVFVAQMNLLRKELAAAADASPPTFHIYSEGTADKLGNGWQNQPADDVVYHMDEDPMLSFYCMVNADRLITGGSTFSKIAARLSAGTSYHFSPNTNKASPDHHFDGKPVHHNFASIL